MLDNKRHNELLLKLSQGDITEKEKWELEKASLNDAFLADALEGYYNSSEKHDLAGLRFGENKTNHTKERKLIRKWMTIAASVLILLAVSTWTFNRLHHSENKAKLSELSEINGLLGQNEEGTITLDAATPEESTSILYADEEQYEEVSENENRSTTSASVENKDKGDLENKAKTNGQNTIKKSPIDVLSAPKKAKQKEGAQRNKMESKPIVLMDSVEDIEPLNMQLVSGVVRDIKGVPIHNAILKSEQGQEAITDSGGNFEMHVMEQELVIASAEGFTSQKLRARTNMDVQLEKAREHFSESPKLLAETMSTAELRRHYKNELEKYIRRNPISSCNNFYKNNIKIRLTVFVSEDNGIDDIVFNNKLDTSCQLSIENAIRNASRDGVFEGSKKVSFSFEMARF